MDSERRRAIYEKVRERVAATGVPMEEDPGFSGWVEEWIADEIDLTELKRRYGELLLERKRRRALRRNGPGEL